MESPDQSNPCAICLGGMGAGRGQAIFTAECSHTFHFHCISASVAHGNLVCPLCNAQWRELPFLRPTQPPPPPQVVQPTPPFRFRPTPAQPFFPAMEPRVFNDDEPVEPASHSLGAQHQAVSNGTVVLKTHCEYSALARHSPHDNFAVLVHLKAPGMAAAVDEAPRAPLDLVTVLDVSGSMAGSKLALLKQAMGFVIDNLGPADRLCVVSFSSGARRLVRLMRMSDNGKALAMRAVESLRANGGTNIAEGLRKAAKVLDERRHHNTVTSVILLSDGQDTYTVPNRRGYGRASDYETLVPPSFLRTGTGNQSAPIHTFGFGTDHDAAAMHSIADATGGTFSFIENEAVIQDAFAQCIGGLLSVVMQEARIAITCLHPAVRIMAVKSGRYESRIDADGRTGSVDVGELYADEERRFLVFLDVPRAGASEEETNLIKVSCGYRNTATGVAVEVSGVDAVVRRPVRVVNAERSVEVERECIRVEATDDIAAARGAAERGAHAEAVEILDNRQRAVAQSAAAQSGDAMCMALESELREMRGRVSNRQHYERSGRAYMLAGLSSHAQQRATSRQMSSEHYNSGGGSGGLMFDVEPFVEPAFGVAAAQMPMARAAEATASYMTPAMQSMLERSRKSRTSFPEPPPPPQQQPGSEKTRNLQKRTETTSK